jgi:RNA polymerase sigma factor (sigma-70 family)
MPSDLELLRAWRAGDRRAGSELFTRHFDSVRRFFLNKIDTGVEDLVQRTFVACVESRDRFREDASFRTYLFAIAHNLLKESYRSKRRNAREVDFERDSIADLGAGPTSLVAARHQEQLVVHALRQIPIEAQVLLELYYWEELTGAELAVILAIPEDTVRSRIRKAKELLQEAIRRSEKTGWSISGTIANLEQWARGLRQLQQPAR